MKALMLVVSVCMWVSYVRACMWAWVYGLFARATDGHCSLANPITGALCVVLYEKQAVKTIMGLLPVPLALTQHVWKARKAAAKAGAQPDLGGAFGAGGGGELSVVLSSFSEFNYCK